MLCDPVDERATLSITCPSTLLSEALRGEANLLEEIGNGNVTVDGELTHLFDVLLLLDTPSMMPSCSLKPAPFDQDGSAARSMS